MHSELTRNIPGNTRWEGSFYERLTEYGEWDSKSFWALHFDLLEIAKHQNTDLPVERELAYMLLYLQQRVLNLISAHFNKNDVFEISNINPEQLYEFKERFEMAILGAISGEVLSETSFDLVNPLVKNA
ncbi:hypothetical protein FJD32_003685 [Shewanella sp. LC6]|uniref:Immunity 41 family protein n=1 Tax=Shewanella xiamenensis TaxID=332186 RepID=A0ABT6UET2_9GAMM|nr:MULTISPECIES: Imm41 family immunity protein [Shewanella]PZP37166.1 MAG: hypothetical protein DI594_04090 [Shewanella oneidensis]MCT8863716.1 immunity 41 family protein [Shewanella xiamenensis]MCT8872740.1 immunity 41 family protein [Shewanella xiamenensis]MCT8876626.1 immunity 41 family protein [Shewanella xiamenensis]MDI5832974.1 immunity 41 family protein [Shewanella xiamenensis]